MDATGGGVEILRTSTLAHITGGGGGDVPATDKPFLLMRVPLCKAVGTNFGPCASFLFLPPCFSSLSLGGTLLGPATARALCSHPSPVARPEPYPLPIGVSRPRTNLPSWPEFACPLVHPKMEPRSSKKDLVSPSEEKYFRSASSLLKERGLTYSLQLAGHWLSSKIWEKEGEAKRFPAMLSRVALSTTYHGWSKSQYMRLVGSHHCR
ncbi:hypothetical protein AMTR_s00006p00071820 [Amborella trichopoda]|uniref:Uncharacterized protein n=1 Tax=Amborella trichopoda TaxID=13333 RepID=W1PDC6_AMBTC|nr:hypothetical protein AMTR_s00006p00071820 [Amborella trichopoda]